MKAISGKKLSEILVKKGWQLTQSERQSSSF